MYEPSSQYEQNQPMLNDLDFQDTPEEASKGTRFANLLLDLVFMLLFFFTLCLVAGVVIGLTGNDTLKSIILPPDNYLGQLLWGAVLTAIYYTATEGVFKGRSIGKLITGTRAVDRETYEPVTIGQAFVRSLCRSLPFAPLIALSGTPWHDSLTKTTVIKIKR